MSSATQVATIEGSPCVNCKAVPCRCITEVVDLRGHRDSSALRRYRFPDGSVLRLRGHHVDRALAAGAVLDDEFARIDSTDPPAASTPATE